MTLLERLIEDTENAHTIMVSHKGKGYRLSDIDVPWQAELAWVKMRCREFEAIHKVTPPSVVKTDPTGVDQLNNPDDLFPDGQG